MENDKKTKKQLFTELEELSQCNAELEAKNADHRRDVTLINILRRVYEAIWKMKDKEDIQHVIDNVFRGLNALTISYHDFCINAVDTSSDPPAVFVGGYAPEREIYFYPQEDQQEVSTVLRLWEAGELTYRKYPETKDSFSEMATRFSIRSVLDVPFSHGTLAISSRQADAFSERDIAIMQELADALSLGYTRYFDFQKLEQQTEQARRERAVERVRAEAMAMRSSNDLLSVVGVMFQELLNMGLNTGTCWIDFHHKETEQFIAYQAFINPRKAGITWISPDIVEINEETVVVHRDLSLEQKMQRHFPEGGEWTTEAINAENFEDWAKRLSAQYGLEDTWPLPLEDGVIVNVQFEYGLIGMIESCFSEEHVTILQELAEALSLGYLRFLDFQKLEEQAERLKLERAVERVRAEVMAMRSSEDIKQVVAVLLEEAWNMGIDTPSVSVSFIDEEEDRVLSYFAIQHPRQLFSSFPSNPLSEQWFELSEDIMLIKAQNSVQGWSENRTPSTSMTERLEYWCSRKTLSIEEKDTMYNSIRAHISEEDRIIAKEKWGGSRTLVQVPFEYGTVGFREKNTDDEHIAIVQDFTEALSLGYVRFLDFQRVDDAQKKLIDELEKELQTAHEMQMSLMPKESPKVPGFDIAGRCLPANHVCGDFYQYFDRQGKWSIGIADITGHSMEAAIPAVMFDGILKTEMRNNHPLENLYGHLNQTLSEVLDRHTFVCFSMGELDPVTRAFRVSNGGCPYPYHFRMASGEVHEIQIDAYPLGIRSDTQYQIQELRLEPGDRIVFCSDGIIEAENQSGELFGFERTAETIRKGCSQDLTAPQLLDYLINEVKTFSGDTPQGDDQTIVVLAVEP